MNKNTTETLMGCVSEIHLQMSCLELETIHFPIVMLVNRVWAPKLIPDYFHEMLWGLKTSKQI